MGRVSGMGTSTILHLRVIKNALHVKFGLKRLELG